jgi:predicted DNA-binding transcriptional regulator AlpA
MTTDADTELMTLQQFFVRFNISKSTWYRLVEEGDAPPVVKIGKRSLVPLAAARVWMQARTRPAQSICRAEGAA